MLKKIIISSFLVLALAGISFGVYNYFNPISATYGKIKKDGKIEETKKGRFAESVGDVPYKIKEIGSSKLTEEDVNAAFKSKPISRSGYNQLNIGYLGISALIPEGFKEISVNNSSGAYYVHEEKGITISFFAKPSDKKAEPFIQTEMSGDLLTSSMFLKGIWYTPIEITHKDYIRTEYFTNSPVFVSRGNGQDYVQLAENKESGFVTEKLKRHIEQPSVKWMQGDSLASFEEEPFIQTSYTIVGSQLVAYNVYALRGRQNEAAQIADVIANSLALSDSSYSGLSLYATQHKKVGDLYLPIPAKSVDKKSYLELEGARVAYSHYEKVQGNSDIRTYREYLSSLSSLLAKEGSSLNDYSTGLSINLIKETQKDVWEVRLYDFNFIGFESKDKTALLNPYGVNGYIATFYHKKNKEMILVATVGDTSETAKDLVDFTVSYAK